jgi:outer membrane protein OmpA-like peptidoglycan-associated protein
LVVLALLGLAFALTWRSAPSAGDALAAAAPGRATASATPEANAQQTAQLATQPATQPATQTTTQATAQPSAQSAAQQAPQQTPPHCRILPLGITSGFVAGKAALTPEGREVLDVMLVCLVEKRYRVAVHTDSRGDEAANQRLTSERAQAVKDYLVSRGVLPWRLEAVGMGSSQPRKSNDTDAGRQANRRLTIAPL